MDNPLASCFADSAHYLSARVVFNRRIADRTFRIRLDCASIAAAARPGQFAMLRLADRTDPLLARPLAFYDTFRSADDVQPHGPAGERRYADFVYLVHGKFTSALQHVAAGGEVVVWGPLGNGFSGVPDSAHLLLVAGGIGQTALLALGRERLDRSMSGDAAVARRVTLCWGARTAAMFGGLDDFRAAGIEVHLATLDGSLGRRGAVIDLLDALPAPAAVPGETHVACCGPEAMMAAVSRWAAGRRLGCHVSLEAPMACGIGICFTCVARVRDTDAANDTNGETWDYRRTCIEGPVFEAGRIVWEA